MTTQIEMQGIDKHYGNFHALKGISLTIEKGSFVALVGPSGCGKSTLLRSIAGLESITGGTLKIAGETMNGVPPRKRDVAMVFQSYALYPHMSVEDNLTYSLRLRGTSRADGHQKAAEVAATTGLSALLGRFPRQLSGGQRQRVAMGRAIIRHPKAFLFDEPLSNLDAALRVQMRKEIRALHDRLGATSVYVTHDQIEAMTMADHVVVLRDGVIEQQGAPLDLYDRPANRFVAGFIGSPAMNFIDVIVAPDGQSASFGAETLPLERPMQPGSELVAGLRPEHLRITDANPLFHITVGTVESTGSATYISSKDGAITVVQTTRSFARPGDRLGLSDEIAPYYQPLVSLSDGKPYGYEVLARWTHATRGPIPPDQFIPTAEASGAIAELTINLLRKACREAVNAEGAPRLSLNLSPVLLGDEGLAKQLLKVLEEANFAPSRLEIELTEAALVADLDAARDILHALRAQGVTVALDNFGKGHASLLQLRQLPFDKLKIDRSFVRRMVNDKESATLVRTIIAMARSLGLKVVAEGVETPEQGKALMAMGCDMGQGYLYGRASQTIAVRPGEPRPRRVAAPKPAAEVVQLAD